ncbi:MAG TPA: right-handed parallel beta-helix repeat-containing protein [Solirubrobacterales bacterium]
MAFTRKRATVAVSIVLALVGLAVLWLGTDGARTSAEGAAAPGSESARPGPPDCQTVVSGLEAAQSAVSAAPSGAVVCLADGSYGTLALSAAKDSPGVTLRAEHPGRATVDGVTMQGRNLTVARLDITNEAAVEPGSTGMTIEHNRISGGYLGVDAGPTDTTTVNDVAILGNKFVGPFGEDAIRLNRYHDANGDGIGVLIQGNEITGVRENGNHSDCLQSVWVGDHLVFRKNYVHDNRCQGFFVKDQASPVHGIVFKNNLLLRDSLPCAPGAAGCGQPSIFQVFGPYTGFKMTNNTIWDGDDQASFQNGSSSDSLIAKNVIRRIWTSTPIEGTYRDNTRCKREATIGGSWPAATPGERIDCHPNFEDPAADDYRLGNGRGVNWAPANQHYGP